MKTENKMGLNDFEKYIIVKTYKKTVLYPEKKKPFGLIISK